MVYRTDQIRKLVRVSKLKEAGLFLKIRWGYELLPETKPCRCGLVSECRRGIF